MKIARVEVCQLNASKKLPKRIMVIKEMRATTSQLKLDANRKLYNLPRKTPTINIMGSYTPPGGCKNTTVVKMSVIKDIEK
jgi:hypothetical protein